LAKAQAVKRKIKRFNHNVNINVQSFRSVSESLFFACAKVFNNRKVGQSHHKESTPRPAGGDRSVSGILMVSILGALPPGPDTRGVKKFLLEIFRQGTLRPVKKLGHPCPSSRGFCPPAPSLRLYEDPKAEEQYQKQLQNQQ